ncbi:MAG: site-2 protease family protein [Pseudomonadota bacterium]
MPWSIPIVRVLGSEIRIHLTFLILLAWIGIVYYQAGGAAAAVHGILFVSAVFTCVVLHELGHAVAAGRYGIKTPDITLLPIGGLARLERIPENPVQEIVIALAGPAVNVVIAAVLLLLLGGQVDPEALETMETSWTGFLQQLAAINIILVLFNMIPAFPMDGGRVLRAVLALTMGRTTATRIAARIGQALAFGFGFLGLIAGNPILVFVAIFVYLAATAEAETTGMMDAAKRLVVDRAMVTDFEALGPTATIDEAADALLRTTQREFPIVDGGGRLRGMLTRDRMISALRETGGATPVLDAMTEIPTIGSGTRLDRGLKDMQAAQARFIAVTDGDGRLKGYISHENLSELIMLEDADWHGVPARQ